LLDLDETKGGTMIDPADLVVPDQPDVRPMHLMHRGHNGFIAIASKANPSGEFRQLYSVRARDLVGVFPQLMPQLDAESYFSVHGFYRGGYGKSLHTPEGVELPAAHRKADDVRWLTCAFADLDSHNLGLTFGQTLGMVIDAQDNGIIPPVTMFQRSGRGLWCFWFLRDRHDDAPAKDWPAAGPVRAWKEKVPLWCAVQRVIGERLAALGSDAKARDVARVTRVPGSINTKVGLRVGYHLQLDDDGQPFVYTLDDLAELLNVTVRPMGREIREVDAKLSAYGRAGGAGRWRHDLHRFRTLSEMRGTWRIGLRNNAALVLGRILLSLKGADRPSPGACFDELVQLWNTFEQRPGEVYSLDDLKKLWHCLPTTKPKRSLRHQTISDLLDVTPEESGLLVSTNGIAWPAASRFSLLAHRPTATRAELAEHRRDALRAILTARDGPTPPLRDLVDMLNAQGIGTTTATVRKDLVAIGVTNPRARREVPAGPELFPG
jgi:hypothetical protein